MLERLRSGRVPGGEPRRQAVHDAALSAVHHQHAAAGGEPQVRLHGPAHDAGGPEPVRERPHHLHANRLDQPGHGGGRGGAAAGRVAIRQGVSARRRRGSIRPRSRTPRRPTRRFGRPAIRSIFPRRSAARLSPDEFKLYDLIWKRTIASQMADARGHRVTITVEADGAMFQVSGKTIEFPGYLRAYVEGSDDPEADLADREDGAAGGRRGRDAAMRRHGAEEPHHAAAQSLQRSRAHPGAGRDGHRPAEHLRLDHRHDPRPRVRVQAQARQRAGAHLDGVRRLAVARRRICPTWSTTSSRPRWKTSWTRSAAARWSTSTTCGRSTSATTIRA